MSLRYYQQAAIKAVLDYFKRVPDGNPCIEAPTGAGKTPIIATLCGVFTRAGARTLCVAHRKELLEQTAQKLSSWEKDVRFSIVSAGLGSKDYTGQVVVAGVQSIYRNVDELLAEGKIDFLIIDEAHLIPATEENAEGMYQTLIKGLKAYNPRLRVIGLTATPYRLNSGTVCGDGKILTEIIYTVSIPELIGNKFLSPLISKAPPTSAEQVEFHIEHGEFKASEVDQVYNVDKVIGEACSQILKMTRNRKSVLIFCCSKDHCWAVANTLKKQCADEVGVVLGDTPKNERDALIRRFKGELSSDLLGNSEKPVKYLCNVEVLTTGFDAPNVDCVALLRPTASPGLYYQMCGRGLRLCEGKKDCLVLDFAGNIMRFGGIDEIEPPKEKKAKKKEAPTKKTCPICFEVIDANARVCPACGNKLKCDDFECPRCKAMNDLEANFCAACGFQFRQLAHHSGEFDTEHSVLSTGKIVIEEDILNVQYFEHTSKKSGIKSLRVDYKTPSLTLSEYVCLEHEGFAQQKAFRWWCAHSNIRPIPYTVRQAFEIIEAVGIAEPKTIKYLPRKPNQFAPEIIDLGIEPQTAPDVFPRTDNPFNLYCPECQFNSFLYEKAQRSYYYVKCARCGAVTLELSPDTIPNENEFADELENFKRHGIGWYAHEDGFDDFYALGGTNVSDLPF